MVGFKTTRTAPDAAACAAVRRCLDEHAAMTLEQLVVKSGMPALTMARTLRRMGAGGQVEVLRPLFRPAGGMRRRIYYRLLRDRDCDYAWQQWVTAPLPVSRFCGRYQDLVEARA